MIGTAVAMFLAVGLLMTHLSPRTRRRLVGYGLVLDVAVLAFFLTVFGGTGGERLGAIGATLGVTCAIHLYRLLFGFERYERFKGRWQWVAYRGLFK